MLLTISVVLYSLGCLIGIILYGGTVWGDYEASLFAPTLIAEKSLTTLRCPVMMAPSETATVKAAFTNSLDRTSRLFIKTHISAGYVTLKQEHEIFLDLLPGETQELQWEVTSDNAAWGRFVMVRVYQDRRYPVPSKGASCGIMVVNFPGLSGSQLHTVVTLSSILLMSIGGGLWVSKNRPLEGKNKTKAQFMAGFAIVVAAGIVVSILGWWLVGGIVLMLNALLFVSLFSELLL